LNREQAKHTLKSRDILAKQNLDTLQGAISSYL